MRIEAKKIVMGLRLPPDLYGRLAQVARAENRSYAQMARVLIEEGVKARRNGRRRRRA